MTATPRIYTRELKKKAREHAKGFDVYSMDDEEVYGPEFYRMAFGDAVEGGHLSDYRVLVIAVNQDSVADGLRGDRGSRPPLGVDPAGRGEDRGLLGRFGRPHNQNREGPDHRRREERHVGEAGDRLREHHPQFSAGLSATGGA